MGKGIVMDVAHKLTSTEPPPSAEPAQSSLELVPPAAPNPDRPAEQLLLIRTLELVQSIHASQRTITEGLKDIKASLPVQRRPLPRRVQAIHIMVTAARRNGFCPCCAETKVCSDTERLPGAEFDHFFARNKTKIHETWLICEGCNRDLLNSDFKNAARSAFEAYQLAVKPFLVSSQAVIGFEAAKGSE
jgi:hypothetical protein